VSDKKKRGQYRNACIPKRGNVKGTKSGKYTIHKIKKNLKL